MGHTRRTTEGILILFASLLLLMGFALVYAAKLPQLYNGGEANINTADENTLSAVMGIDRRLAKLICEYRKKNGNFTDVDSLRRIRLLTKDEAEKIATLNASRKIDITTISPEELSAKAGISPEVAYRILEAVATRAPGEPITTLLLSKISLISSDTLASHKKTLRVRDANQVTISFWIKAFITIGGFFIFHLTLRKKAPNADPYLVPCVMVLSGLGCIILFSIKHPLQDTDVFGRQVQGVLIGIAFTTIPLSKKFSTLRLWRYTYLYAIFAIILTIALALFGKGPGGTRLSLLGIQPIEIVKLALAFFVASYLAERWSILSDRTGPRRRFQLPLFRDIGPLAIMYFLSLATFIMVKDLGPMLVLFGMFVVLLYVATGNFLFIIAGFGLTAFSGCIAYFLKLGVFDVRVDMWFHPWANSHANGMHLAQSLWALATGGLWGSGLGLGQPNYIPRAGSDLVFSSLGEEIGLLGTILMLILYSVLLSRCFRIAIRARNDFERFLGASIASLLGIQTVVIIFGVLGLLPLTGITLPFTSFGRSSMIASFFALGLLLSISSDGSIYPSNIPLPTKRALNRLATSIIVLLLGGAGICRLMWIQGIQADQIAGSLAIVPDADGISRPHINPRLKAIEARIPRGTIFDRNNQIVAFSNNGRRLYPYGGSMVHLVGYLDSRYGGPTGIEESRNNDLRGFDNYSDLLPIYRLSHMPHCPKLKGKDIRLTIDARLQVKVENALRKYANALVDKRTGRVKNKGAAVVLDVHTGEVLAAVSIPNFDPNKLSYHDWRKYMADLNNDHVLINRALNGLYPPGSTFKIITAATALQNGVDFKYICNHSEHDVTWRWKGKTFARKHITDLEDMSAHGLVDMEKGLRVSCNLYFAHLAMELGPELLYKTATKGFKLEHIPPPKLLAEDLADSGYGQGRILVTPLEMARVAATIANNGIMMKPQFIREIRTKDGKIVRQFEPIEMGRPLNYKTAAYLRKMMVDVTTSGTAKGLFEDINIKVAGKTGSAENEQGDRLAHSWFVGFAPADDPRIAFAVVIENGGFGSRSAGPVCREIVKAAL